MDCQTTFGFPMFDPVVYTARRQVLMDSLRGAGQTGLVLFPANVFSPVNYTDNCYPFRQDSTFLYYFGLQTPGLAGVLNLDSGESLLFGNDPGIDDLIWAGDIHCVAELVAGCGARAGGGLDALCRVLASADAVHYLPPYRARIRELLGQWLGQKMAQIEEGSSRALIHDVIVQRLIKEPRELAQMEQAVEVSRQMYAAAMELVRDKMPIAHVLGAVTQVVLANGGGHSFVPIITNQGQVLHNHDYAGVLARGEMLLMDSGFDSPMGYASDITRVMPVGGRFSSRQRDIYMAVLDAQRAAIAMMRPGVRNIDCHRAAARSVTTSLQELGLMRGDVDESVAVGAHALFFPHGLGHAIGLDVHDMESLGEDLVGYDPDQTRSLVPGFRSLRMARTLQPGHALTVEPGLYFIPRLVDQWKEQDMASEWIVYDEVEKWLDFGGIRLEDDVVITETGARILGDGCIGIEPDEVEAMCS